MRIPKSEFDLAAAFAEEDGLDGFVAYVDTLHLQKSEHAGPAIVPLKSEERVVWNLNCPVKIHIKALKVNKKAPNESHVGNDQDRKLTAIFFNFENCSQYPALQIAEGLSVGQNKVNWSCIPKNVIFRVLS